MRKVDDGKINVLFRGIICRSNGYMDALEGCILLRGLYVVQGDYMLLRRVIWIKNS